MGSYDVHASETCKSGIVICIAVKDLSVQLDLGVRCGLNADHGILALMSISGFIPVCLSVKYILYMTFQIFPVAVICISHNTAVVQIKIRRSAFRSFQHIRGKQWHGSVSRTVSQIHNNGTVFSVLKNDAGYCLFRVAHYKISVIHAYEPFHTSSHFCLGIGYFLITIFTVNVLHNPDIGSGAFVIYHSVNRIFAVSNSFRQNSVSWRIIPVFRERRQLPDTGKAQLNVFSQSSGFKHRIRKIISQNMVRKHRYKQFIRSLIGCAQSDDLVHAFPVLIIHHIMAHNVSACAVAYEIRLFYTRFVKGLMEFVRRLRSASPPVIGEKVYIPFARVFPAEKIHKIFVCVSCSVFSFAAFQNQAFRVQITDYVKIAQIPENNCSVGSPYHIGQI